MPPRRSHKKSRAGCKRCKARKIKCDEIHPRCGNCTKHGVPCDFEFPEAADGLSDETQTPHSAVPESPMPSSIGSTATSSPPTTTELIFKPLPLYRAPQQQTISTSPRNSRILEMRLLHHYTTITCKTLALTGENAHELIWRDTVPNLAFSGSSFLADALLSVAALHLRSHFPQDQQLIRASHSYMASTLSEYSARLSKGIDKSNAEALFLTAALIAFQSTAARIFTRDDGGDVKERSDGYTLPLSWFHSFQGVKAVVASSWQWLRESGVVLPIIESQPALNLNISQHNTTYFGYLLDGLEDELSTMDASSPDLMLTRQAYLHAVAVINWAHHIPHTAGPLVFLATVSRRFIDLLEERRPRALAILATYFGLLKALDGVWWLKGVARREVMGIISLFDPDDAVWWPRLQWPLRIALCDGPIPPDVWGADWQSEQEQNGDFVTHIELLSKMFSALQDKVASDIPDALDMVSYSESVIADRAASATPSPVSQQGSPQSQQNMQHG